MDCQLNHQSDADSSKSFTFDGVFGTESKQEDVFNTAAYNLVANVMEGYNGTIFAYGQTGCGKTWTMEGSRDDPEQAGIIPRCFRTIFASIARNTNPNKQFLVQASYMEIYNEEVRDLLSKDVKARLQVKEDDKAGIFVKGLSHNTVCSEEQISELMSRGNKSRTVGATLMNADSSRSHSIFMVRIETSEPDPSKPGSALIKAGKLNLVDLAGSERQTRTQASGQRLKEATKINLSLSALGNVISALVAGSARHIPYRDSQLTRLLQDSLGGNTKTVMLAAVSPASDSYDETLSTLRYASRAKQIKNKPKINEDPKDAKLREYQDEISRLKALLAAAAAGGSIEGLLVSVVVPQSTVSSTVGSSVSNNLHGDDLIDEATDSCLPSTGEPADVPEEDAWLSKVGKVEGGRWVPAENAAKDSQLKLLQVTFGVAFCAVKV